jgi:hypothetical protein
MARAARVILGREPFDRRAFGAGGERAADRVVISREL